MANYILDYNIKQQVLAAGLEPYIDPITHAWGIEPGDMYFIHHAYVSKRALCDYAIGQMNRHNDLHIPILLWDGHLLSRIERYQILALPECQETLTEELRQRQYEEETDDEQEAEDELSQIERRLRATTLSNAKAHSHPTKIGKVLHEWGAGQLKTGRKNKAGKQTRTVPHTKAGQKQAIRIAYEEMRHGRK